MRARASARPSLLKRALACLVSAAMVVAFTPVVAWGNEAAISGLDSIQYGNVHQYTNTTSRSEYKWDYIRDNDGGDITISYIDHYPDHKTVSVMGTQVGHVTLVVSGGDVGEERFKIEITKRNVTVRSTNDSKIYDGKPLTCPIAVDPGFATFDDVDCIPTSFQTDVGTTNNATFEIIFNEGSPDSYNITKFETGILEVTQRVVTLKSADLSKEFDGEPLTNGTAAIAIEGAGFVEGQGVSYTFTGSQKIVGSSENKFEYEPNYGTNLDNYVIKTSPGKLEVTNRSTKYEITLTPNSKSVTYDGTEKSVSGFKTLEFQINGQTFYVSGVEASATGTDAGEYPVTKSGQAVVTDVEGNNVTDQFIVNIDDAKLVIGHVPPSDPSYFVPAAGEGGVAVRVTISGSTAVVAEISASALESAAGSGATTLTIDLSGLPKGVTQAQFSKTTVDKLLAVVNDTGNAVESVTVNLGGAVLVVDAKALAAISEQAKGTSVTLGVAASTADSLNSAQKHALSPFEVVQLYFEAQIKSGGAEIHDFGGGSVRVSVALEPRAGHDPARYVVLYVGEDGSIERYATSWAAGLLSFTAPHFSAYAVVYVEDATQAAIDTLEALPVAGKLKTSQAKEAAEAAQAALAQAAALDAGQKMLVDEALVANAEAVIAQGAELVAAADAKAANKVKSKSFSVKAGKSKSIYFKTKLSSAGTKVTYKKASGSKYITVTKAGKVTAKKGMRAGKTYTAKVKVICGKAVEYVKVTVKAK